MPVSNCKKEIMNTKESICHKISEGMYHIYTGTLKKTVIDLVTSSR
jgi:hypothetical protein